MRRINSNGFAPVLIAIGILSLLATMSLVNSMTAGILNKKQVEKLNRAEAFYSGELLAWHAYGRVKAGFDVSGGPVSISNNYAKDVPGEPEGGDGAPSNIVETRLHSPATRLIRRYDPARYLAQIDGNEASCGRVGYKGSNRKYRLCLASSGVIIPKSLLQLSYIENSVVGGSTDRW